MGTTQSFFFMQNKSYSTCDINGLLDTLVQCCITMKSSHLFDMKGNAHYSSEKPACMEKAIPGFNYNHEACTSRVVAIVSYYETAKWLGFYEEALCDGQTGFSQEAFKISESLGTPILVLSVYDDDVLYFSYANAENNEQYDHIKPNSSDVQEFFDYNFSQECPAHFLCTDDAMKDELLRIWGNEEYKHSIDRLEDICKLIGIYPLWGAENIPPKYRLFSSSM